MKNESEFLYAGVGGVPPGALSFINPVNPNEVFTFMGCAWSTRRNSSCASTGHLPPPTPTGVAEQVRDQELASPAEIYKRWAPMALESEDSELALKVIDRLLKIQERRAKLLGLEAPAKVDMMTGVKMDPEKVLAAVREFSPALYNHRQAPL